MTAREVDIHTLPGMLTALRLPSFHKLWAEIATRADAEPDRVYRRRLSSSFCGDLSRALCAVEVPFCCCG